MSDQAIAVHDLVREARYRWMVPKRGNMRVPGVVFASEALLPSAVDRAARPAARCRANRQAVTWAVRRELEAMFGGGEGALVYDVSHNLAKLEVHEVDVRRRLLCVHRRGATRALPAGHPDLPAV